MSVARGFGLSWRGSEDLTGLGWRGCQNLFSTRELGNLELTLATHPLSDTPEWLVVSKCHPALLLKCFNTRQQAP